MINSPIGLARKITKEDTHGSTTLNRSLNIHGLGIKHLFLCLLGVSFLLSSPGCSLGNKTALFGGEAVTKKRDVRNPHKGKTLGDLEEVDVLIEPQTLEATSVERVLASYREALSMFTSEQQRQQALRRMADLTMVATEDRLVNAPEAGDESLDVPDPQVALRDADYGVESSELISYQEAITLYEELIVNPAPDTNLAEVYYLLAKAYDLNAELEKSLEALNNLVTRFPNSPFHYEAQFRRGEILFSMAEYEQATPAYADVLASENEKQFYEHALYKQGWTQYKLNGFDDALIYFVQLLDHLHALDLDGGGRKTLAKIKQDTFRVTSMTFSNLDGPFSARNYFADNGSRDYENEIYKALASLYLRQERYRDAAETYETFVAEHPLHPEAPAFTTAVMDVYSQGGFPKLILPVKEQFVYNYGVNSEYWQNATPEQKDKFRPELKRHLVELAQHYHSVAQKSKTLDDYKQAAVWYREFLQTFPTDLDAPVMNNLLAEILFSAKDYLAAVTEFEKTAYNYENFPDAGKAGYFSLVAYQEFLKGFDGTQEQKQVWIKKRIDGSVRFAENFPDHPKNPQILDTVLEDYLALNDIDGAVRTSRTLLRLDPLPEEKVRQKAWKTIANGEFDLAHYPEAEAAIDMVLSFASLSVKERRLYENRMAAAIYKQAEELRNNGYKEKAAEEYLRVGFRQPNSKIRVNADYDAGVLFMELTNWARAIAIFEGFRSRFPTHQLVVDIPAKLALAYEKTGQFNRAASELEAIAKVNAETNPELARQAIWQAAEYQEQSKDTTEAIRLYKQYVWNYEEPYEQNAEGKFKLVGLYEQEKDWQKRHFWLNKLVRGYDKAGSKNTARTQYLAAYASYQMAEPAYREFKTIPIKLPLKKSLKKKKAAMKIALDAYTKTAELGVAEFLTASTYKIGEIYRILAKDLMESERPKGLGALELEQYDILLEEQALPFEDQAIELYETNASRTLDNVYDEWVKNSFSALGELLPGRYAKKEQVEEFVGTIY